MNLVLNPLRITLQSVALYFMAALTLCSHRQRKRKITI